MRDSFLEYLLATRSGATAATGLRARAERLRVPIGRLARRQGWLVEADLQRILEQQQGDDRPFGELAEDMGLLGFGQIRALLHLQRLREAVSVAELLVCSGDLELDDALRSLTGFCRTLAARRAAEGDAENGLDGPSELGVALAELSRARREIFEREIQLRAARAELAAEREAHDLRLDGVLLEAQLRRERERSARLAAELRVLKGE